MQEGRASGSTPGDRNSSVSVFRVCLFGLAPPCRVFSVRYYTLPMEDEGGGSVRPVRSRFRYSGSRDSCLSFFAVSGLKRCRPASPPYSLVSWVYSLLYSVACFSSVCELPAIAPERAVSKRAAEPRASSGVRAVGQTSEGVKGSYSVS